MRLAGRMVAITGGGSGLGADACRLARTRGARAIAVVDRNSAAAGRVATEVGGMPVTADVASEQQVRASNALTSNPVSAAYAATKHAELALAEWLHYTYASRGITTCCFCPKGMLTPLLLASAESDDYARSAVRTAVTSEERRHCGPGQRRPWWPSRRGSRHCREIRWRR